jgi:hypothetical protein
MSLPPLSLSPEDTAALNRKLCYSRWLYYKGEEQAEADGELNQMLAMTHFFNAIEITTQNILLYRGWMTASERNGLTFDGLIERLDKKDHSSQRTPPAVPRRQQVLALKAKRNDIIHHGTRFHSGEVEEARKTCRRYLKDACKLFLDLDIDKLSMADLIRDSHPRDLIQSAESLASLEEFQKSLEELALAFEWVEARVGGLLGSSPHFWPLRTSPRSNLMTMTTGGGNASPLAPRLKSLEEAQNEVSKELSGLQKHVRRLHELSRRSLVFSLLDTKSATEFFSIAPFVSKASGGEVFFDWRPQALELLSLSRVERAINFVTESVLRVESILQEKTA